MRPGLALLSRLRYARKFLVIGMVLLLPLAWVSAALVQQQTQARAFTSKELTGLRYVQPLCSLLVELVNARSAAVQGSLEGKPPAGVTNELAAAIAAVDAADADLGQQLDTSTDWTELRAAIEASTKATGVPRQILDWYSQPTDAVLALIQTAANNSNLILDPDLDSYYVMNTTTVALPTFVASASKTVDLQRIKTAGADGSAPDVIHDDYTLSRAAMISSVARMQANLEFAVGSTSSRGVPALAQSVTRLAADTGTLVGEMNAARSTPTAARTLTADTVLAAADQSVAASAGALRELLEARVDGLASTARSIAIGVVLAGLLAAYLFFAFYRSVTVSVAAVVASTERLAAGDFTRPVPVTGRDELTDIAVGVNAAVERMRTAITGIAEHAHSLAAASRQVTSASDSIGALSTQTTEQAGVVASSAEQVSAQVQSVVTEQLAASIEDFAMTARSATEVLDAANQAVAMVSGTRETMIRLGDSSRDIGEVMHLITSIAEQTNLLALNATIEAARAGDAGRGFAVVAGEVKELARESAEAAESIAARIRAIQVDTEAAATASAETRDAIVQIQDNQHTIAAAMEEQAIHAREIGQTLEAAVDRSTDIARDVAGFATTAEAASSGAADMRTSAAQLAGVAQELSTLVDTFVV
jgi:methyl-accepting chemotaxis protein